MFLFFPFPLTPCSSAVRRGKRVLAFSSPSIPFPLPFFSCRRPMDRNTNREPRPPPFSPPPPFPRSPSFSPPFSHPLVHVKKEGDKRPTSSSPCTLFSLPPSGWFPRGSRCKKESDRQEIPSPPPLFPFRFPLFSPGPGKGRNGVKERGKKVTYYPPPPPPFRVLPFLVSPKAAMGRTNFFRFPFPPPCSFPPLTFSQ